MAGSVTKVRARPLEFIPATERLTFAVDATQRVSALLQLPPAATACFVFAHGAVQARNTAGKPSAERAEHLLQVKIPMLFLQGTRDELAKLELLQPLIDRLGARATLKLLQEKSGPRCWMRWRWIEQAIHSS